MPFGLAHEQFIGQYRDHPACRGKKIRARQGRRAGEPDARG
jgi:hypothetical protein